MKSIKSLSSRLLFSIPKRNINLFLFLIVSSVVISSCAKKLNPSKPDPEYVNHKLPIRESKLRIPFMVSVDYLEEQISAGLEEELYKSEDELKSDWGELDVKITRNGNLDLKGSENALSYRVPIHVDLKISTFLFSKKVNFDALLDFSTVLSFKENWQLATKTEFLKTTVLNDAQLSLGFISIPLQTIMDGVMDSTEDELEKEIDKALQENLSITDWAKQMNTEMQQPYLINEEYESWLQFKPQYFEITPIKGNAKYLYFTLGTTSLIDVTLGQKPISVANKNLPPLKVNQPLEDQFDLQLPFEIQYQYLKDAINNEFGGTEYEAGKKKFKLDSVDLYANGNKLVIESFISGDVAGRVFLSGIPSFNSEKKELYLKDLDYDVKTKKAILKLASWVFKSTFKDKMEKEMRYSLKEDLDSVEDNINDFLRSSFAEGKNTSVTFDLKSMNIDEVYLDNFKLSGFVESQGELKVYVK